MLSRLALALSCLFIVAPLAAQEWPLHFAEYSIEVVKADGVGAGRPSLDASARRASFGGGVRCRAIEGEDLSRKQIGGGHDAAGG